MTNVLTVAAVYGYMKKPMKSLHVSLAIGRTVCLLTCVFRWSPGHNAMHTVHADDVAGGLWAASEWMFRVGRDEALKLAGEEIAWKNDRSKLGEVTGMPPPDKKIIAPLFNLVSIILLFIRVDVFKTQLFIDGRQRDDA